jgi:hypothetical protein
MFRVQIGGKLTKPFLIRIHQARRARSGADLAFGS